MNNKKTHPRSRLGNHQVSAYHAETYSVLHIPVKCLKPIMDATPEEAGLFMKAIIASYQAKVVQKPEGLSEDLAACYRQYFAKLSPNSRYESLIRSAANNGVATPHREIPDIDVSDCNRRVL